VRQAKFVCALLTLTAIDIWAQSTVSSFWEAHQAPDRDGIYYTGPEVTAPRLIRTVFVPYPDDVSLKETQGMTVLAMIIDADGAPTQIQILHKHGEAFDQAAIAAVKHSVFEPGRLGDKPVPVWIDVRVVFHANRSQAVPQILITERDLTVPDETRFEDKHRNALSYTAPVPIHTVDAGFQDPFAKNPYIQVAVVEVLVGEDGLPKKVRVARGLGFGLDEKAAAAVWQYRFIPAMKRGKPIADTTNVRVSFAEF
jgi:TonB family protein